MRELLTADAVVLDPRSVVRDGGVVIDGDRIVDAGPAAVLAERHRLPARRLPGVLMPGLVDAHSHLRGTPLTAHGLDARPLEQWLCTLTTMTTLPSRDEALLAAAALLRTGVTTVQVLAHSFAAAGGYAAEILDIAAGAAEAGIGTVLAVGLTDTAEYAPEPRPAALSALPSADRGLAPPEYPALVSALAAETLPGRTTLAVGPVGPQWCTDAALDAVRAARGNRRVHAHLHESAAQRDWLAGGPDPLARLEWHGLVDSGFTAAHGVHLTDEEIARLAAAGAALVHCPVSNERLAVGTARVRAWLDAGACAALGIDSQDDGRPDMFEVMRAALRAAAGIGTPLSGGEAFALATTGGAGAVGDDDAGTIAPGRRADLVHLALGTTAGREIDEIVEGGSASRIPNVWAAGIPVVVDGRSRSEAAEASARARIAALLAADAPARADRRAHVEAVLAEVIV